MPPIRRQPLGSLPTFATEKVHVIVDFDKLTKSGALLLTCPRRECGRAFILMDDPGVSKTAPCPYCFKTANHV